MKEGGGIMDGQDSTMRSLHLQNSMLDSSVAELNAQLVVAEEKIWKYRVSCTGLAGLCGLLGLGLLGVIFSKQKKQL